ncbi:glutathione S-transferase [Sphingobium sufflavum]|uniref:glutathione S-transferase n=1 Tax=Sphingobium sufflavum TaxID=1129547 RepID=UPI001F21BAA2|nr:glutathione S-transferase [Sphingobium sufflavum]MCE7795140.1 glutathione S-transferase [Sphingobium sufflavum]
MSPLPILYSFRRCPYAMRARLALLVSGQAVVIREVKLRAKPAAMLAASPKGTVPVLCLPDGTVIEQSLDIMRWALGRGDPEGWLAGDDAALVARNDGPFKHHLDRTKYPDRHGSDPAVHRGAALELLADWDARLAATGYLCGPARTLADMAVFPFVRQFAAVDPDWFAAQPLPHVHRWLARHLADPLFGRAMIRLSPWAEGDDPIPFGPIPPDA